MQFGSSIGTLAGNIRLALGSAGALPELVDARQGRGCEEICRSVQDWRAGGSFPHVRWGLSLPWTLPRGARVALKKSKALGSELEVCWC